MTVWNISDRWPPSRYVSMQSLIAGQWFALPCARSVKRPPPLLYSRSLMQSRSRPPDGMPHTDSVISILTLTRRCKPGGGGHDNAAGCSPEIGRGRDHGSPLTLTRARRTKDQNGWLLSHRGEETISSLAIVIFLFWLFCEDVVRFLDTCPAWPWSGFGVLAPSHLPSTNLQEKSNQIRLKTWRLSQKHMQP